jgi:hypothetical protein
MNFLPLVVRAKHIGNFRIHVVFNDGVEATLDFEPWLEGPVFEPLKQAQHFSRFFVEGGAVVWPNGADIAPETIYEAALGERANKLHPTAAVREKRAEYKPSARRRRG